MSIVCILVLDKNNSYKFNLSIGEAEEDNAWRMNPGKQVQPRPERPISEAEGDSEWRSSAGKVMPAREERPPRPTSAADENSKWRSAAGKSVPVREERPPRPTSAADENSKWRSAAGKKNIVSSAPKSSVSSAPKVEETAKWRSKDVVKAEEQGWQQVKSRRKEKPVKKTPETRPRRTRIPEGAKVTSVFGSGVLKEYRKVDTMGVVEFDAWRLADGAVVTGFIRIAELSMVKGEADKWQGVFSKPAQTRRRFGDRERDSQREDAFGAFSFSRRSEEDRFQPRQRSQDFSAFGGGRRDREERGDRASEREERDRAFGAFGSSRGGRQDDDVRAGLREERERSFGAFGGSRRDGRGDERAAQREERDRSFRAFGSSRGQREEGGSRREEREDAFKAFGGGRRDREERGDEQREERDRSFRAFGGRNDRSDRGQEREDRESAFSAFGGGRRDREERGDEQREERDRSFRAFGGRNDRSDRGQEREDRESAFSAFGGGRRDRQRDEGECTLGENRRDGGGDYVGGMERVNRFVDTAQRSKSAVVDKHEDELDFSKKKKKEALTKEVYCVRVAGLLKEYMLVENKPEFHAGVKQLKSEEHLAQVVKLVFSHLFKDLSGKEVKLVAGLLAFLREKKQVSLDHINTGLGLVKLGDSSNLLKFFEVVQDKHAEWLEDVVLPEAIAAFLPVQKETVEVSTEGVQAQVDALLACGLEGQVLVAFAEAQNAFVDADIAIQLIGALVEQHPEDVSCAWVAQYAPFLAKVLYHEELSEDETHDQVMALYAVQRAFDVLGFPVVDDTKLVYAVFMNLFKHDIISDMGFIGWKEDLRENVPGRMKALVQTSPFLEWLEEDELESDF